MSAPMFNEAEKKLLVSALNTTWQEIAPDAEAFVDGNAGAVEVCIDADRLTFNCGGHLGKAQGQEAARLISAAISKHSYSKVLRALCKLVSFK